MQENLSLRYGNNKDADQAAQMRSLIRAFVIHFRYVLYLHLLQAKFQFSRWSL